MKLLHRKNQKIGNTVIYQSFLKVSYVHQRGTLCKLEATVQREQLMKMCSLFQAIFSREGGSWLTRESIEGVLEFGSNGTLEEHTARAYLDFLSGKDAPITKENAIPLFQLAMMYQLTTLEEQIIAFVQKDEIEEMAILHPLVTIAFTHHSKTSLAHLILHLIESGERWDAFTKIKTTKEIRSLIYAIKACMREGISFSKCKLGGIKLIITSNSLTKKTNEAIKAFKAFGLTTGLKVKSSRRSTPETIQALSEILPDIKYLCIIKSSIRRIPNAWARQLKVFVCSDFYLNSLSLPEAEEVDCVNCVYLSSLSLPKAKKVNCGGCCTLDSLSLPNAKKVACRQCPLTNVFLPEAEEVDCSYCRTLSSLSLPKAKIVYCGSCPRLFSLSLPLAEKVACEHCPSLTDVSVPERCTFAS